MVASPQLGPVCPLCQSSPLFSLVLGDGQVSHPHRLPGLLAGVGLWNSKAQKVQSRLVLLCLNLPPTTLLPSSSVRCSFLGTHRRGENPEGARGHCTKKPKTRLEEPSGILACWAPVLVTLGCVWVDGHSLRARSSWDVSISAWQEILPGMGRVWQGLTGQWAQA